MDLSLRVVAVCFAVILGGCLGSFLNVAVWRLPAGMSLVKPGSFCPKCRHPIRFYDNIPVFGWLFLRGRCRDCRGAISFRYPMIEGLCALIAGFFASYFFIAERGIPFGVFQWPGFAPLAEEWMKYLTGERLFPPITPEKYLGVGLGMTFIWSGILYLLLAIGLIESDGKKVPASLLVLLAAVTVTTLIYLLNHRPDGPAACGTVLIHSLCGLPFLVLFFLLSRRVVPEWICLCLLAAALLDGFGGWAIFSSGLLSAVLYFKEKRKRLTPALFFFALFAATLVLRLTAETPQLSGAAP